MDMVCLAISTEVPWIRWPFTWPRLCPLLWPGNAKETIEMASTRFPRWGQGLEQTPNTGYGRSRLLSQDSHRGCWIWVQKHQPIPMPSTAWLYPWLPVGTHLESVRMAIFSHEKSNGALTATVGSAVALICHASTGGMYRNKPNI